MHNNKRKSRALSENFRKWHANSFNLQNNLPKIGHGISTYLYSFQNQAKELFFSFFNISALLQPQKLLVQGPYIQYEVLLQWTICWTLVKWKSKKRVTSWWRHESITKTAKCATWLAARMLPCQRRKRVLIWWPAPVNICGIFICVLFLLPPLTHACRLCQAMLTHGWSERQHPLSSN